MSTFKKMEAKELPGNPMKMFDDGWALITAGTQEKWNTMTIAWGSLGWTWYKPICTTYVRQSRYTYQFLEQEDTFVVSLFDEKEYRKELSELGKKSGRDMDKMHNSGLTPMLFDGYTGFSEAKINLVCKKLYADVIKPENILSDFVMEKGYSGANTGDYHMVYIAEIVSAYVKE